MLPQLKPTDDAIEKLALAETDLKQVAGFAPLRWGFLGNLGVIAFAGALGMVHALLALLWRRAFSPSRDGTR
jgi:hypothetical protein